MSKVPKTRTEEKKKKGPGRPRKNPVHKPKPRNGISNEPKDVSNYMEYLYDQPLITKKLWAFFKSLFMDKLEIIFREDEIIYYGEGHQGHNKVRTCIDAKMVNHYYAKKQLNIGVTCGDMGTIMAKIDKSYNNIIFVSHKNSIRKNILVTLENDTEIDEIHKVGLVGDYNHMNEEEEEKFLNEEEYPISFVLTGKYFKKMISDIKSFGKKLVIKQDSPEDHLEFGYQKTNGNVQGQNVCRNKKKVRFKSKLKGDESFRVEIFIEFIKPLSSATLADEVTIYAAEDKPLLVIAKVDATEVRILTGIIDEREDTSQ